MSKQKARTPALKTSARRQKDTSNSSADTPTSNHSSTSGAKASNGYISPSALVNGGQPLDRSTEIAEKVKELVRLAQEQGYLTYNDISEVLPDTMISAEEMDEVLVKLRGLEVEIVDQAEVDRVKQPEPEEEEDKTRLDILDDPVRMYL